MKQLIILIAVLFFAISDIVAQKEIIPKDSPIPIDSVVSAIEPNVISSTLPYVLQDGIPMEIQKKCAGFFDALMNQTAGKAYQILLQNSPLSINEDKIRNQVVKTVEAIELYGIVKGFENAGVDIQSPSYIVVTYLSLHKLNPLQWIFTFYKSPELGWMVLNFRYTDTF